MPTSAGLPALRQSAEDKEALPVVAFSTHLVRRSPPAQADNGPLLMATEKAANGRTLNISGRLSLLLLKEKVRVQENMGLCYVA